MWSFNSEEEFVEFLKEKLRLTTSSGGFTDPNSRTIKLKFGGETICETSFDVVQTGEYEG